MDKNELNKILAELYLLEPDLRGQEEVLVRVIEKMSDWRPDTRFDKAFAARLKAEVLKMKEAGNYANNNLLFNIMNKKIFAAVGSLAVLGIAAVLVVKTLTPRSDGWIMSPDKSVSVLPGGAFGSLSYLVAANGGVNGGETAGLGGGNNLKAVATGLGGGGSAVSQAMGLVGTGSATPANEMTAPALAPVSDIAVTSVSSGIAPDMKIMPYYSFKYVYKGEALTLDAAQGDVYRRLKGDGVLAANLGNLIGGLNLDILSMDTFRNLKFTNVSLVEDRDNGLMIGFDFNEDNIYISENWEKWRIMEREACGGDAACWDRFRLRAEDVPADADLIAMSDKFLSDHQISLTHYGEPVVDNVWRDNYAQAENKADVYIPEYATVIYPLLVNGEAVRDQGASYAGLRVTINLLKKAASGVNGLTPYRYESSSYGLATEAESVVKAAENGGLNRGWYGGGETQTLELGTPVKSYVQTWKYTNNRNEELLVPALIFPVLNAPKNYYGQKSVVVPLVKEMLDELNNQPIMGGGIEPMPLSIPGAMIK